MPAPLLEDCVSPGEPVKEVLFVKGGVINALEGVGFLDDCSSALSSSAAEYLRTGFLSTHSISGTYTSL